MAEGGGEFGYDDHILDYDIDHDDDDDEQEVNRTQPFQPGAASTPYHGGEQHEMQTMHHEQSGLLDTSDVETPLLSDFTDSEFKKRHVEKAYEYIKSRFPKADFKKLGPIGFGKKQSTQADIVSYGPKGGETAIFKKDGSGFLKSFTDKFKNTLGPSAEQIIVEDRNTLQQDNQRLEKAEKERQEAEKIVAEQEREKQEIEVLKQKIAKVNSQIDAIHDEHGSNLEMEAERKRLELLKKNLEADEVNKKKNLLRLKNKPKTCKRLTKRFKKQKQSATKLRNKLKIQKRGCTEPKLLTI